MLDERRKREIYKTYYKEPKQRLYEGLYLLGGMTGTLLLMFGFVMIYLKALTAAIIVFIVSALFFIMAIVSRILDSREQYSNERYEEILAYGEKSKAEVLRQMEESKKIPKIEKPSIGPKVYVNSSSDPLVQEKVNKD